LLRTDCIEPNAENASEAELLATMEAAPNKRSYRRLAAIRALCEGYTRAEVGGLFRLQRAHGAAMDFSL